MGRPLRWAPLTLQLQLFILLPYLTLSVYPAYDNNDHWETTRCPPAIVNVTLGPFRHAFEHANNFFYKCTTNSDISLQEPNPYQLFMSTTGVPDHPTTLAYTPQSYSFKVPINKPLSPSSELLDQNIYRASTLGGLNVPVGVAINGVPFFSALSADNVDAVQGRPGSRRGANPHDDCMGFVNDGAYNYKTAPPCLYASSDGKGQQRMTPPRPYDAYNFSAAFGEYIGGDKTDNIFWTTKMKGAPFVIGIALDGHLIYSPYDENGDPHAGLDSCNGKVYEGTYAYFASNSFPYILGCFGPGVYSSQDVRTNKTRGPLSKCSPGRYSKYSNHLYCLPCPAGRYNLEGGSCKDGECDGGFTDEQCSGKCEEGYFCPSGSSSPRAQPCGGPQFFCPAGSADKSIVEAGYYSTPLESEFEFGDTNSTGARRRVEAGFTRTSQTPCDPGYFCTGDGIRRACSQFGKYGNSSKLTSATCTAECPLGSYCVPTSPVPIKCPAGRFGGVPGLKSPECSGQCEVGHYCESGSQSATQSKCPAGRYGADKGLRSSACSHDCDAEHAYCKQTRCQAGYFCPPASTRADANECGGPDFFCPAESGSPTPVTSGFYTLGQHSLLGQDQSVYDEHRRFSEAICEEGRYCAGGVRLKCAGGRFGSSKGNTAHNCDGPCKAGYFCPNGSVVDTQNRCGGPHVYCPAESAAPIVVPEGYYSITGAHDTRQAIAICPIGSYCVDGTARLCPGKFSLLSRFSCYCKIYFFLRAFS